MKSKNPRLVSIVLTTLNCAAYLRQAIDSCLAQTYPIFELIMVDGGSTDGTLDIIAEYTDPRIRLLQQLGNEGKLPGAINVGLANAKGEYLTWMQGDSIYHPRAIEKMVDCLQAHHDVGQVYADFLQIDEAGKVQKSIQLPEPQDFLKKTGDPAGVCFLIRRAVREAVGIHDVSLHPNHDYDYRVRIALQFSSFHIREPLYSWRYRADSLSGTSNWHTLARGDIPIRLKHGLVNPREANRELAGIDVAYAFECYQNHRFRQVPTLVWAGMQRDFRFGLNPGVWAIGLRSLLRSFLGEQEQ